MGFNRLACGGGTVDPLAPTTRCFLETAIPSETNEPTTLRNTATGHGYLERDIYTTAQFTQEGDAGGGIEGYHPSIVLDEDGVPTLPLGTKATTNQTSIAASTSRAGLIRNKGAIYRPMYWPSGAHAGKKVTVFRVYDAYTATNQSDRDELYLGLNNGQPSMDRSDLSKVAQSQQGVSYDLSQAWAGQWMRFLHVNSNRGGRGQYNLKIHAELADGTVITNQTMAPFVWNEKTLGQISQPQYHQRRVNNIADPNTGTQKWVLDGEEVPLSALVQPLQAAPDCNYLPISFDVVSTPGGINVVNAALGAGAPYKYSIDGVNYQEEPFFPLTDSSDSQEKDLHAPRVTVMDSAGIISVIKTTQIVDTDPIDMDSVALRITDTPDGANNNALAVSTNNPTHAGGYVTEYGKLLGKDNDMLAADWGGGYGLVTVSGYLRFGSGKPDVGGMSARKCFAAGEAGKRGFFQFDVGSYYYGRADSNIVIDITARDQTDDSVLGTFKIRDNDNNFADDADIVWPEHARRTNNNQLLEFVHTGNPICFDVADNTGGPDLDATSQYWRLKDVELWQGAVMSAAHRLWRVNGYIEARGIELDPEFDEPATINVAPADVSSADQIKLTGNVRSVGTLREDDKIELQYRLDGGAWVSVFHHAGRINISGQPYLNGYNTDTIDASAASTMEQRWLIWGSGGNVGYRFYDISSEEVAA